MKKLQWNSHCIYSSHATDLFMGHSFIKQRQCNKRVQSEEKTFDAKGKHQGISVTVFYQLTDMGTRFALRQMRYKVLSNDSKPLSGYDCLCYLSRLTLVVCAA